VIIKCSKCMVKYFFLTCLLVVTSIVVENWSFG
jgi:hypothetical protein